MIEDFTDITNLLIETTSNDKPMTFKVKYQDKNYVVKKIKEKITDCLIVDECKKIFALNEIGGMIIFRSLYDISKKNNKIFKNKNNIYKTFLLMNYIPDTNMIYENIDVLSDSDILYEYIKCAVYRGIWRVTDFCTRNILISKTNIIYSIDENEIGMQKKIIKKKDLNNYIKRGITKDIINKLLDEFLYNIEDKIKLLSIILKKYEKEEYLEIVCKNISNLRTDIYIDLEFN